MKYLLIPLMCILAVAKITLQSDFSKKSDKTLFDSIYYNMLMFSMAALVFSPFLLIGSIHRQTLFQGIIMGVLSVIFQFFYVCAFSKGKMTLTVIINNFSMLIPIAFSYLVFGDPLGLSKTAGIALTLVSLVMISAKVNNSTGGKKSDNILWAVLMVIVFLSNGFCSVNQKVYSITSPKLEIFEFVAIAYISASLISAVILLSMRLSKNHYRSKLTGKMYISGACAGIILGIFQCIYTYSNSVIHGTMLYSTYNCATSILSVMVGRLFFKEKLTIKQLIGVIIGIVSILLLCI